MPAENLLNSSNITSPKKNQLCFWSRHRRRLRVPAWSRRHTMGTVVWWRRLPPPSSRPSSHTTMKTDSASWAIYFNVRSKFIKKQNGLGGNIFLLRTFHFFFFSFFICYFQLGLPERLGSGPEEGSIFTGNICYVLYPYFLISGPSFVVLLSRLEVGVCTCGSGPARRYNKVPRQFIIWWRLHCIVALYIKPECGRRYFMAKLNKPLTWEAEWSIIFWVIVLSLFRNFHD